MSDQSYLKASVDGVNGSGKTCTVAQLACGLAKEYGNGAVHVFDSSDRWPAWKVHIFDKEGVPLVITYGKTIVALQEAIDRAEQEKASVFVADDLTVPWMDGLAEFAYDNGSLPFDRRQQLVNEWNLFVEPFQFGEFHSIACGRLGYHWENVEDEDGNEKLHQGDSKFNAGGSSNFAYDCILELEMRRRKRRILGLLRGRTSVEYLCDVIKDANDILNDQQFIFSPFGKDGYQKGDYRKVLDCFRTHIEFRRKLKPVPLHQGSTSDLIVGGKTAWAKDQAERRRLLENIAGLFDFCYGSQQSSAGKMFRNLTLEAWGHGWSWSSMEENASTAQLENYVAIMQAMRRRAEQKELPHDQSSLLMLLKLSMDDVREPDGKHITLIEAMGIEPGRKNGKPQRVVKSLDHTDQDEQLAGD